MKGINLKKIPLNQENIIEHSLTDIGFEEKLDDLIEKFRRKNYFL